VDKSTAGRLGAAVAHSRHSGAEMTAKARRAFHDRFEEQVDPEGVLPPDERRRRAEHARRAHMQRLAARSAQARRRRRS